MKRILSLLLSLVLAYTVISENVTLPYKVETKTNQMGTIAPSSVIYNYYNSNNKLSEILTFDVNNLNKPAMIESYVYDEAENIEKTVVYTKENDGLRIYHIELFYYDGNNRCIKKETFGYILDNIGCTGIVEYIYDGNKLVKEVNSKYDFLTNVLGWDYDMDYKTFNDKGLPLTAEKTTMYSEAEGKIVSEKIEYVYDDSDRLTSYLKKIRTAEGSYIDNRKEIITYTSANKIYTQDIYITNMSIIAEQLKYTYDASNILIKKEIKNDSWDNPGTLALSGEYIYTNAKNYSVDNAPKNFKVENQGVGSVKLSWEAPTNTASLKGFDIFVDGVKYGETITENQKVITELVVGEHFCMVQAKYDEIGANTSNILYFNVSDPNCVAPTNLTLVGEIIFDEQNEDTPINMSWTAPVTTYSVLGYNIYVNGKMIDVLITDTKYTNKVYTTGDYTYELVAVYKEGISSKSEPLKISVTNKFKVTLGTQTPPWVTLYGAGWHYDGSDVTIKAEPKTGYEFVKWTEKLDGDGGFLDVSTESEYTFKITRSTAFSATLRPANGIDNLNSTNVSIYSVGKNIQIKTDALVSKVEVIDITGRVIKSLTTTNNVNVDNSGVYVVRVSCGDNTFSKKIIVK